MPRSSFRGRFAALLSCTFLAIPMAASAQSGWVDYPGRDMPAAHAAARLSLTDDRIEQVDFGYQPLVSSGTRFNLLLDENFYLLTLIDGLPMVRHAMQSDPMLRQISSAAAHRAKAASLACQAEYQARDAQNKPIQNPACTSEAMRWTIAERSAAREAIARLYDRTPAMQSMVTQHMRPSGRFHRDAALKDRAFFIKAWDEAQDNIDRLIRVYALAEKPRYHDIDSAVYPQNSQFYRSLKSLLSWEIVRDLPEKAAPYHIPLHFGLALLEANRHNDAARQLRVQESQNQASFAYLKSVNWSAYSYAAIIVPGWSPTIAQEPMNPGRKVALRTAVKMYQAGDAPVIIVSGAQLRPIGTPYSEAFEMKAYLVKELGIPAHHILINPISRHTTTEIRDNGRMALRMGAPITKKSLYISEGQYIGSQTLEDRLIRDLGYLPWQHLQRRDFTSLEFIPNLQSLHREASDPMNP